RLERLLRSVLVGFGLADLVTDGSQQEPVLRRRMAGIEQFLQQVLRTAAIGLDLISVAGAGGGAVTAASELRLVVGDIWPTGGQPLEDRPGTRRVGLLGRIHQGYREVELIPRVSRQLGDQRFEDRERQRIGLAIDIDDHRTWTDDR